MEEERPEMQSRDYGLRRSTRLRLSMALVRVEAAAFAPRTPSPLTRSPPCPPCILPPSMLPACLSLPWSPAAPSSRRTRVTACYCMVVDCVQSQCEVRCLTPSDKQRGGVVAPEAEVVLSTAASDCGVAVLCY